MRRSTRRVLWRAGLAGVAVGAAYVQARWPGFAPGVVEYARSGEWHRWAYLAGAFLVAVFGWRMRPARRERKRLVGDANRRTSLYRWYSTPVPGGRALYIGVAFNPAERAGQHSRSQPWWWQVRSCTVEWFDTRTEAFEQEERAIKRENPIHNDIHNGPRADYRKAS